MPDRYRKKPVEITAVQLRWSTWNEVCELLGDWITNGHPGREITAEEASDTCGEPGPTYIAVDVMTIHGDLATVRHGDWILPEPVAGRFYPCKPDVFAVTYDPAPDDVDVRWGSSVLPEDTPNPDDADEIIPAGVFLTCHGDDLEDVRAVLRVEHAVAEDGAEVSRPLAAKLAALLNQQHVEPLPGETE